MLTVNLEGELALITGGGTGIGYAIASAFVDAGASVVIVGRREDVLRDAAERLGPKVVPITHDVTDLDSAEALFDCMQGIIQIALLFNAFYPKAYIVCL